MKNPPRLVPKGRSLRRRQTAASASARASASMTLPWTLSSQALYLLRVWHKHLPNGHLNGHGISVAPYKPPRHAKEHRERNKPVLLLLLLLGPPLVLVIQRQQYLKYALQNLCYACHSRRPLPLRSLCQCQTHKKPNQKRVEWSWAWRTKQK